jgi:hypothetical protein
MPIFNNQDPQRENNVGQFGATDESIGAYKQAAEYAKDAEYWAKISKENITTIEDLLVVVEDLYRKAELQEQDINQLKADFRNQDARLMQLISQTQAATDEANNAIQTIDQKIIEVQNQLDIMVGMYVTVDTLPPNTPASGTFDSATGELHLNIPQGASGSVTDLSSASVGVPDSADWGFYVESIDNTVHRATMSDIAKTFPSVQSVSYNGGAQKEIGNVDITKDKLGLGNVTNVEAYSKTEVNNKVNGFVKTYTSKAEATNDVSYRTIGEKVLVWNGTTYEFYDVVDGGSGLPELSATPTSTEKRLLTVNLKEPDVYGNIDVTIPTGNPSLYLGELLMFPYDPNNHVSYPGLKPADGSLISKADAPDLGPSLVAGQLPVVSETAWQAGAKQYFSWGKLADGVTDADETNYINIRLPDWTDGTAVRSPSKTGDASYAGQQLAQIPYITTVNGISPVDATGAIVINLSDFSSVVLNNNQSLQGKTLTGTAKDLIRVNTADKVSVGDSTVATQINSSIPLVTYNGTTVGKIYSELAKPTLVELGAASSGANSDITSLTALTSVGSKVTFAQSPVVPDPVGAYDVATKRYVDNQSGGSGASLNGVMNFGVGSPYMVMSRALIKPYETTMDGQIVLRADYPDLWAYAQALTPITDASWLADPLKRGVFSSGNGTTTFRIPDWNGVVKNGVGGATGDSVSGLFARGDGGVSAANGLIKQDAAPNIVGSFSTRASLTSTGVDTNFFVTAGGALTLSRIAGSATPANALSASNNANRDIMTFDASTSSVSYGRDATTEVYPSHVTAVWAIRSKGGFTAANTSWSVINGDAALPANGSTVLGGAVVSEYQVAGVSRNKIAMQVKEVVGGDVTPILTITPKGGSPVVKTIATIEDTQVKYVSWNDSSITPYLTFSATSASDELMVSLNPSYAHIYGIVRKTFDTANTGIVTIAGLPSGKTAIKSPHAICHLTGGATTGVVPNIVPSVAGGVGSVIRINNPTASASSAIVDITIVFQ